MMHKLAGVLFLLSLLIFAGCGKTDVQETTELKVTGIDSPETQSQTEVTADLSETAGEKTEMDRIWKISDKIDFVTALSDYIAQKCEYGDNMDTLSEAERVFYVCLTMDMEVNNGGFNQYFFNSSGDNSAELVAAFEAIGAVKTADICRKAIAAFGQEIPADRFARQELLEELDDTEFIDILDECDNAFYDYEEDLYALYYAYVMANREAFT